MKPMSKSQNAKHSFYFIAKLFITPLAITGTLIQFCECERSRVSCILTMGQENDHAISIDRMAAHWANHRRFHALIFATSVARDTELT